MLATVTTVGRIGGSFIGVCNIMAAVSTPESELWLKIVLAVAGLLCTITMLFFGTLLTHIANHSKEQEQLFDKFKVIVTDTVKQHATLCKAEKVIDDNKK